MTRAKLNALLWLALFAGLPFLFWWGGQRVWLEWKLWRLSAFVGALEISDPSLMHVRAIETGEPLHFLWRVYFPAGYSIGVNDNGALSGSNREKSPAMDALIRIRYREIDGELLKYEQCLFMSSGPSAIRGFEGHLLLTRRDELVIEQAAVGKTIAVPRDGSIMLLRMKLPEGVYPAPPRPIEYHSDRFRADLPYLEIGDYASIWERVSGRPYPP